MGDTMIMLLLPSFDKRQGTIKHVRGLVEAPGPSVCVPATSQSLGCRFQGTRARVA